MKFLNKSHYKVHAVCESHVGNVRKNNEDNFLFNNVYMNKDHISLENVLETWNNTNSEVTFIVFDGMGGESLGELASYTAAKKSSAMSRYLTNEESVKDAFYIMNNEVVMAGKKERVNQIGTTMSMVSFNNNKAIVGNIGDSPIFLFRNSKLELLSELHTNEKFLREQGINNIKPGLTQFLGMDPNELLIEPYINSMTLHKKDIFVICSDGLTDMVSIDEIKKILENKKENLKYKVELLVNKALEVGGKDNITVILCEIK